MTDSIRGANSQSNLLHLSIGMALGPPSAEWLATPIAYHAQVEPVAWSSVAAALAATSLIAIWIPARRALRVDPIVALRDD
jgi:ABC-type antimicrobial peptide transport system permease subunit